MSSETRTFRGATLEEILPRIRAELGPDAVITRQREGLTGGFAGFFQKQFVEVEAHAGAARFDVVDDSDALPDALQVAGRSSQVAGRDTRHPTPDTQYPASESPAIQRILEQAAPFAEQLSTALERVAPVREEMAPVTGWGAPAEASQVMERLVGAGLHPVLAEGVVAETVAHHVPFSPQAPLERLVCETLARRIPVQSSWTRRGRTIGFVGPGGSGKTLCSARLAATYARGGHQPVICMTLRPHDEGSELATLLEPYGVAVHPVANAAEARARIAGRRDEALTVIDTPAVSPSDRAEVERLAADLEQISVYEVHLTLPATVGSQAAGDLLEGFAPLGVSRIALTHADETRHVGPAVGLAIGSGRPFSYISSGTSVEGGLFPVNPQALASIIVT